MSSFLFTDLAKEVQQKAISHVATVDCKQKIICGIWLEVQFPQRLIAFASFSITLCAAAWFAWVQMIFVLCVWRVPSRESSSPAALIWLSLTNSTTAVGRSRVALFSLSILAVDRIDFAAARNSTAIHSFNFFLPSLHTHIPNHYKVIRSQREMQPLLCGWFTDRKWSPPISVEKSIFGGNISFTLFCSLPQTSAKTVRVTVQI